MIFSSVLKTRLEGYLKKVESAVGLAAAVVDGERNLLVKSEQFDDKWLFESRRYDVNFEDVACQGCGFQLASKPTTLKLDRERLKKLVALVKENIEFLIMQEQEAQGLAQEVLEKYEELNLLYDLISELSLLFDEEKICELTLKKAMRVLDVSSGVIFLENEKTKELELVFHADREDVQKLVHPQMLLEYAEKVTRDGKEILIDDAGRFPKSYFDNLKNKELSSLLAVPIHAHDKMTGTLVLIGKLGDDTFQSGDIKLAEAIAGYAGITIQSNRLVEQMRIAEALQHEMKLARNIQQSLLPRSLPQTEYFDVDAICEPAADVGGDYFSVNQLSDSLWEFVIADVSGHGIGAAMTMASLRSILRSESRLRGSVKQVVESANMLLAQDTEETGMYATLFLARFNAEDKTLTYCNAGHLVPLLWRNGRGEFERLDEGGLPVGMFAGEKFEQRTIDTAEDDLLVMFTDGVTEARDDSGSFFGEKRLQSVLRGSIHMSANEILNQLMKAVREFQHSELQRDDITVVVVKRK